MKQHPKQLQAYEMAERLIGLAEIRGPKHNDQIVGMFAEVGHSWVKDDETAWCAAFMGSMLHRAGLEGTGALNARSYEQWKGAIEIDLEDALPGDVAVFWRNDKDGWQGHVGFYVSHGRSHINVLGGNQANEVSIKPYPINGKRAGFLGVYRMLAPIEAPKRRPGQGGGLIAILASIIAGWFRRN